jgi:hypothetical protein
MSSKKIRKKKEVENENYDILQLDEKIKRLIQDETKNIDNYRDRVISLSISLSSGINFSYRKKKEIEEEKQSLVKKINDLETNNMFSEYICVSQKIINEYMQLLLIPMNISFFGKKKESTVTEDRKEDLLDMFLEIAKKYVPIRTYKKEIKKKLACECGNSTNFTHTENTITCEICGIEINIYTIQTNFKDINRVNLSQKYKYSKRVYFRDTVNRYEGKQNKRIDKKVYDDIEVWFEKHNLLIVDKDTFFDKHDRITKDHVYMALSETGHNLHYEDINLLHNQFTGVPCPNISHVKNELFEDFDKVMAVYKTLEVDRVNSLNSQYILYQLLRRRKVKVNVNDFGMLKTRERLIEYDEIHQQISLKLEWTFFPTV